MSAQAVRTSLKNDSTIRVMPHLGSSGHFCLNRTVYSESKLILVVFLKC